MNDVPLWRLNLLRAFYLLVCVGLALNFGPLMFQHSDLWAQRKGETAALLSGLAILCVWGLRYPLQLLAPADLRVDLENDLVAGNRLSALAERGDDAGRARHRRGLSRRGGADALGAALALHRAALFPQAR